MDPGGKIQCLSGKPPQGSQSEQQGAEVKGLHGSYFSPIKSLRSNFLVLLSFCLLVYIEHFKYHAFTCF